MDGQSACTGFGKRLEVALGLFDHQMHIEGQSGDAPAGLHNEGSHGDVGDKVAVHDIDVQPVRTGRFAGSDLFAQTGEVGGKDGCGNYILFQVI